jgi:hypothetical protein
MCMIYVDESDPRSNGSPEDIDAHVAFARKTIAAGQYVTCDALDRTPSAATVRVRDGRVYRTDGPFAETKEALGGFYILDCKDLDEAVALAAQIPPATHGSIEVRPFMEIPGWEESIVR